MGADRLADVRPYGQKHALPFVVAGAVGVGLAEISRRDGAVDRGDDLGQADVLREAGQHVATPDAPFRAHEPGTLEGEEDLFEVGLGQSSPLGNIAHRGGVFAPVEGEGQQRAARIVATRRDSHSVILPGTWPAPG